LIIIYQTNTVFLSILKRECAFSTFRSKAILRPGSNVPRPFNERFRQFYECFGLFETLSNLLNYDQKSSETVMKQSEMVRNIGRSGKLKNVQELCEEPSGTVNGQRRWTVWNIFKITFTFTFQNRKKLCLLSVGKETVSCADFLIILKNLILKIIILEILMLEFKNNAIPQCITQSYSSTQFSAVIKFAFQYKRRCFFIQIIFILNVVKKTQN
jgi:hypothetical protein